MSIQSETDIQIIERLRSKFKILTRLTNAVMCGDIRALIVQGPPGVGKSFGIETELSMNDSYANLAGDPELKRYEIVKGNISALHLYLTLFTYKDAANVVVLDDVELTDDSAKLELLKSVMDSSGRRFVSWRKQSRVLQEAGIPTKFEFKGGVILVTNLKTEMTRSAKLRAHLQAIDSRCHTLDLSIDTNRDKFLRIKQVVEDGMLHRFHIGIDREREIVKWIGDNLDNLKEVSLRSAIKAAELVKLYGDEWTQFGSETLIA